MTLLRCVFCFAENSCRFAFTKKGKPYISCRVCFTRAFLNRMESLRGPAVCPELINGILKQLADGDGGAQWARERMRTLKQYVNDKISGVGLPEAGPDPMPYVDTADSAKEKVA